MRVENYKIFRLKKGFNIALSGECNESVVTLPFPSKVAVKPGDIIGFQPKLLVKIGDTVQAGDPLVHDKKYPDILLTAPASGRISRINRGERRRISEIMIDTDRRQQVKEFDIPAEIDRKSAMKLILESGLFPYFIQRPFARLASPIKLPRDIFISGNDTAPLAMDEALLLKDKSEAFQKGLDILNLLTDGKVWLSSSPEKVDLYKSYTGIDINLFTGPHPSGNTGVHIHHLAPIRHKDDFVWTICIKGILQIGSLFLNNKTDHSLLVKVAGSGASNRQYFKTISGAQVTDFASAIPSTRIISGNVLTGTQISDHGFLGFFDNLITIIPEATQPEFIGWMLPGLNKISKSMTFLSSWVPGRRKLEANTNPGGSERAFVATGIYRNVLPMDIYPAHLMKSIIIKDIEEMEGLGIYELAEEDVALCEYICPSKIEFQQLLREGLEYIEKEG